MFHGELPNFRNSASLRSFFKPKKFPQASQNRAAGICTWDLLPRRALSPRDGRIDT